MKTIVKIIFFLLPFISFAQIDININSWELRNIKNTYNEFINNKSNEVDKKLLSIRKKTAKYLNNENFEKAENYINKKYQKKKDFNIKQILAEMYFTKAVENMNNKSYVYSITLLKKSKLIFKEYTSKKINFIDNLIGICYLNISSYKENNSDDINMAKQYLSDSFQRIYDYIFIKYELENIYYNFKRWSKNNAVHYYSQKKRGLENDIEKAILLLSKTYNKDKNKKQLLEFSNFLIKLMNDYNAFNINAYKFAETLKSSKLSASECNEFYVSASDYFFNKRRYNVSRVMLERTQPKNQEKLNELTKKIRQLLLDDNYYIFYRNHILYNTFFDINSIEDMKKVKRFFCHNVFYLAKKYGRSSDKIEFATKECNYYENIYNKVYLKKNGNKKKYLFLIHDDNFSTPEIALNEINDFLIKYPDTKWKEDLINKKEDYQGMVLINNAVMNMDDKSIVEQIDLIYNWEKKLKDFKNHPNKEFIVSKKENLIKDANNLIKTTLRKYNSVSKKILALNSEFILNKESSILSRQAKEEIKKIANKSYRYKDNVYQIIGTRHKPLTKHVRYETVERIFSDSYVIEYTHYTGGYDYDDIVGYKSKSTITNKSDLPITLRVTLSSETIIEGSGAISNGVANVFNTIISLTDSAGLTDTSDYDSNTITIKPYSSKTITLYVKSTSVRTIDMVYKITKIGNINL